MATNDSVPGPRRAFLDGRFDPLSLDLLSVNLRHGIEATDRVSFPPANAFPGAGLYALYYVGDLDLYTGLSGSEVPIYVGKAEAGNSSYGDPADTGPKLFQRIADKHATSVLEVENANGNLRLEDFEVRYLTLDDVWIVLGERALLRAYAPVLWNTIMPGFGANAPGTGRQNARSVWDSMHPGRPRAGRLCNRRFTRDEMRSRIKRAIAISLMPAGAARQSAVSALRQEKASMIWSPSKSGKDQLPRVFRVDDFLAENAAFGADLGPWVDATGDASAMLPDPEEAAEANVLDAESPAEDLL